MSVRDRFLVCICSLIIVATSGLAYGDQRDARLAPLFEKLKMASGPTEARMVEQQIWIIWLEIEDPLIGDLLERGLVAMGRFDLVLALTHFDQIVKDAPAFAEGWHKRSTVHYFMGNLEASVRDIQQTLALEPRHFGALSGLAVIYDNLDKPAAALRSFEAALAIHPHLSYPKQRAEELRKELAGSRT
jgi:tetratricopeptide (TPR) repeat protein